MIKADDCSVKFNFRVFVFGLTLAALDTKNKAESTLYLTGVFFFARFLLGMFRSSLVIFVLLYSYDDIYIYIYYFYYNCHL